ncbi:uncharacterized protein LOC130949004 [Arachis stenosperma]|uniref:uncharacterized protein LOC130949004 n=1 Tax=Arachis stenosperma TaxID=217475 RepID=UPI0025ACFFA1|nr:uncharacterized protein LOC130949004 [Arachis stenosperma]
MEFRSKSCRDESLQIGSYKNGGRSGRRAVQDLRCYSANHAVKTGNSKNKESKPNWNLNDPELQRKKRVASYKIYSVEGKMKGSLRKSFRWIKNTCSQAIHGWRGD